MHCLCRKATSLALCALWLASCTGESDRAVPPERKPIPARFTDVTAALGVDFTHESGARGQKLNPETFGPGAGWFDADGDGDPDLLLVNGNALGGPIDPAKISKLYRNDGALFTDVTAASGLDVPFYGMGFAAADIDNDGDSDIFIYGLHRSILFANDGSGRFRDVTASSGLENLHGWVCAAAFLDADRDGALDLVVGNYVDWRPSAEDGADCTFGTPHKKYCPVAMFDATTPRYFHGRGDGTFLDATAAAGLARLKGKALGIVVEDFNRDGAPDVFVANDSVPNFLLVNRGDGSFDERGIESGFATDADGAALAGMGIDSAWAPDDGPLLLAIGNFSGEPTTLHVQEQIDYFRERSLALSVGPSTLDSVTFGLRVADLNLDGLDDLITANGHVFDVEAINGVPYRQRTQIFLASGWLKFEEQRTGAANDPLERRIVGRALATADFDDDGDLDLVITENQGNAIVLRNDLAEARRCFVRADLRGTKSNRDGIGAEVTLVTKDGASGSTSRRRKTRKACSSYLGVSESTLTFGLQENAEALRIDLRWPSGRVESFAPVKLNARQLLVEGEGRSADATTEPVTGPRRPGADSSIALRAEGIRHLEGRRVAEALPLFERAIALDPHDFVAHRFRLIALWILERREALDRALDEAIERFPSAGLLVSHFALVLRETGYIELARRVLLAASELEPRRADIWKDLGNLAFDQNDFRQALAYFAKALELHPDSLEALTNSGKVHMVARDWSKARAFLERALALDPNHAPALNDLGGIAIQERRLDDAETLLRRALEHAHEDARQTRLSTYGNLAILYFKRRDRARALEYFEKVLELDPNDPQARKAIERLRR